MRAEPGRRSALAGPDAGRPGPSGRGAVRARGGPERARGDVLERAGGEVIGRITIVQEDRIRLVEARGRGYLFVVRKRAAPTWQLERWRDERVPVRVRFVGIPGAGALAVRVEAAGGG